MVVLSDRPNCSRFKAVRDVYLPGRKLWLSQDHGIEHAVFEQISSRLGEAKPLGVRGKHMQKGRAALLECMQMQSPECSAGWRSPFY